MKKILNLLIIPAIVIAFASCDDPDVDFTRDYYSLHYDETLQLSILTERSDKADYTFSSADKNVVTVNNSGLATGVFVGRTEVTVSNGETSDDCKVEVIPYETLFEAPILNINELTMEGLRLLENRELISSTSSSLVYKPSSSDQGIDSLKYEYKSDHVLMTAFLKEGVLSESVYLFLNERYSKNQLLYTDHRSKAIINYYEEDGYILYTFF